jgi:hypothetical protein
MPSREIQIRLAERPTMMWRHIISGPIRTCLKKLDTSQGQNQAVQAMIVYLLQQEPFFLTTPQLL